MSELELMNISKAFGGIKAVDSLSVGFNPGKITGLIGPNGAGKTTVFNLISGFLRPDEGEITYKEKNIEGFKPWQIAQSGIGRLFQDVHIFDRMPAYENIMTAFNNQKGENPLNSVFTRWLVKKQEKRLREKANQLLEMVGLQDKAWELAENLSFGQQKLLSIARLLAAESDVLLLDEPTAGVNPQMFGVIKEVIRKIAREGKIVAVIEHNMNVIMEIADFVYFMDNGQMVSFGKPNEVLGDPEVRKAYIGI